MRGGRLSSGGVLPSGLVEVDHESGVAAFNRAYHNTRLRAGIVLAVCPSTDERNVSRLTTEYDVLVVEQDGDRGTTALTYRGCVAMDPLGGVADFSEKRLRGQTKSKKFKGKTFQGQDGNVVLLLCLDGVTEKAVILGGLQHPDRKSAVRSLPGDKVGFEAEYNGVNVSVADDGAFKVTSRGATDSEGKPKSASRGNTVVELAADGSLKVDHGGASLSLDKSGDVSLDAKGKLATSYGSDASMKVGGALAFSASKKASAKASEWAIAATGTASFSGNAVELAAKGRFVAKGAQLSLEASSLARLKGATVQVLGQVFLGSAGGTPALTLSTQFIGVGNSGMPVVSTAVGPFSSKVFIS
ncbi:MAG: hypothetical protein IT285_16205 [Bdellovibrionales bacterium]|nr:hypothetical protein [Bdellovibrionales bacterium]